MDELVRESFALDRSGRVEQTPAGPVLRGVLICGETSKWGYDYPLEVWTPETLKAYEGLPSFSDHNKTGELPSVANKVGWYTNVRKRSNGKPEADYHLNPKHPLCESIVWAAEHNPSFYALSHQAYLSYGTKDGRKVVRAITRPVSVDLVVSGATTGGIFEHAPFPGSKPVATTVKVYLNKLGPKLDIDQLHKSKTLLTLVKEGYGDSEMPATAPDPAAETTTADGGMDAAFLALCTKEAQSCIDAKGDPAVLKKCLGRMKKLLMTHAELSDEEVDEAPDEEEEEVEEGAPPAKPKPKKKVAATPAPTTADPAELLGELAAEGYTPTMSQLTALKTMTVKSDRIAFIKEQKGLSVATAPRSKSRDSSTLVKEGDPNAKPTGLDEAKAKARALAREVQGLPPEKK